MEKTNKDYYKILEVSEDADEATIKNAYRNLSKKYHPDMNENKTQEEKLEAEAKFKDVSEAYAILSDPEKRRQHDLTKTVPANFKEDMNAFASSILEDILKDIFKPYGGENISKSREKAFENIKKNSAAFDEFQEFYKNISEQYTTLFNRRFTNIEEYINPKNRCRYTPAIFNSIRRQMQNLFNIHKKEWEEKLKNLTAKLQKRNLNLESYLAKRKKKTGEICCRFVKQKLQSNDKPTIDYFSLLK